MPKLLKSSEIRLDWSDLGKRIYRNKPLAPLDRTPGIHLSGVIRHVLKSLGKLNTNDDRETMPLVMFLGMAWEEAIVTLYPKLIWQPGEQSLDGIHGTPDGLSYGEDIEPFLAGEEVIEEFKYTLKSQRTHGDVINEHLWMWQLAGYCCMMQCNYARLHVCWSVGNYKPPSPMYCTYLIEFPQQELEEFWGKVILTNKGGAKPE